LIVTSTETRGLSFDRREENDLEIAANWADISIFVIGVFLFFENRMKAPPEHKSYLKSGIDIIYDNQEYTIRPSGISGNQEST
jgi:hypothetical protein